MILDKLGQDSCSIYYCDLLLRVGFNLTSFNEIGGDYRNLLEPELGESQSNGILDL